MVIMIRRIVLLVVLWCVSQASVQAKNHEVMPKENPADSLDMVYTKGLLNFGTEAPDFVFTAENGEKCTLSSLRGRTKSGMRKPGKWVVLDFWATWCPDCRKEIPMMKTIYKRFSDKVEIIGVSFDTDKNKFDNFVKSQGIEWLQYSEFVKWKDSKISKQYKIRWLPTIYLIAPDGKVAYTTVCAENLMKRLEALDKEEKLATR